MTETGPGSGRRRYCAANNRPPLPTLLACLRRSLGDPHACTSHTDDFPCLTGSFLCGPHTGALQHIDLTTGPTPVPDLPWSPTVYTPPRSATVFPLRGLPQYSRPPRRSIDGRVRRGWAAAAARMPQSTFSSLSRKSTCCALSLDAHDRIRLGDCLRHRQRRVE